MPDRVPPTSPQPPNNDSSGLPPRLLAKLKVEIDGYELIERLGEGGQATVYRAIQKKDGRTVAVKVLHAGPHATEEARARLKREINALRAINHPNIVHAIAAGRTRSGLDCLVMNFIDGRPLDALWEDVPSKSALRLRCSGVDPGGIEVGGPTSMARPNPDDHLRLFKTICETVQAAHRKGITHRDLSPSNILIDVHGQPHILDFGMASTAFDGITTRDVTVTGQFIGKLKYASPEQARGAGSAGESIDIRSDVYALGVMLYQLLTGGAFPYEVVGNVIDVLHNIIHSRPKPPSQVLGGKSSVSRGTGVPPVSGAPVASVPVRRNPPLVNETIEAIVLKALEKDPQQRYQSAGELAADIDRYLAGQPTSAAAWSKRAKPASTFSIRRRPILAAVCIVLAATLVGVTMNAKSLAVWLGLSTAIAPVLPIDHSPLAPQTAEASAVPQPADADSSQDQLNRLAKELAFTDARLSAVHAKLRDSFGVKSPESQDGPASSSLPMGVDVYTKALEAFSAQTGRELAFTLPSTKDRNEQKTGDEERFARAEDEAPVKARREELQAQQAALWAQLAWGTFTGRDGDDVYTYRTKVAPDANVNTLQQARVLDAGVKLRRIAADAMNKASVAAKATPSDEESTGTDLVALTNKVAQPVSEAVKDFLTAITGARSKGQFTDAESKSMQELRTIAEALQGAANHAGTAAANIGSAQDEVARSSSRAQLQEDLRVTGEQAAKLDQALVAAQKAWGIKLNADLKLPAVGLVVAKRPESKNTPGSKARSQAAQVPKIVELFPPDSRWSGTFMDIDIRSDHGFVGKVTDSAGTTATIEFTDSYGRWEMKVGIRDGRLVVLTCIGLDADNGPRHNVFRDLRIGGPIPQVGEPVELEGTWTITRLPANKHEFFKPRWTIRNDAPAKPAIDIAKLVRGTWSGTKAQTSTPVNGNGRSDSRTDPILRATISRRANGSLELETVSADGTGRNHYILEVQGDALTLDEGGCSYTGPSPRSFSNVRGKGTISEFSIQFDFSFLCTPKNGIGSHTATASMTLTKDK